MADCSRIDSLVTPYVDGELDPPDRDAIEAHLGACPPCRRRIVAEQAVRELMQARRPVLRRDQAPALLRDRCAKLAREGARADAAASADARRATRWFGARRLEPLAIAAALVLVVGGAFIARITASSPRVMAAELTADHVKCFAMNAVLRTQHTTDAVESEMASQFDWDVELPADAARAGLELVGSRPCLYGEGRVAHIMYRHNGHPVSLFMLPRTAKSEQLIEVLGHEAAIWSVGDRTFVLIARETRSEVERMATFVQAALQSH